MRAHPKARRRATAGLLAATLLLAACGGSDDSSDAAAGEALPQVDESAEAAGASDDAADASDGVGAAPSSPTAVDLVGADLLPASDVESNPLPSVVVDDINTGRKVNFKNLVPQEKPILLWMWAPH